MRTKSLLILAAVVGLFAAYIVLVEVRLPTTDERRAAEKKVLDLEADDIVAIRIERGDAGLRLERAPAGAGDAATGAPIWRLTAPLSAPADPLLAGDLAAALAALERQRTLESTTAQDAGIDTPRAVVVVETAGAPLRLVFGPEVPGTSSLLLAVDGRDEVYQVPAAVIDSLERPAGDWRDKSLFAARRGDITRVVLEGAAGRTVLARQGDDFRIEAPVADRADPIDTSSLSTQLTSLTAERFLDEAPGSADADERPQAGRIEATLAGREAPFVIELGASLPDDPDLRRARVDGQLVITRSRLADLLALAPGAWRDPRWTRFQVFAIDQARFGDGAGITTLVRQEGDWQRDGEAIDYAVVSDLLAAVTAIDSQNLVPVGDLEFAGDDAVLEVTLRGGEEGATERLTLRRLADGRLGALADGRDAALVLETQAADTVIELLEAVRRAPPEAPAAGDDPPAAGPG